MSSLPNSTPEFAAKFVTRSSLWFRGFIQGKTRIVLAWIFASVLIFSAKSYPTLPGIFLCFFGASIRYWASGYLKKDSRPAVGGPYAFTRNPLYLGTYLMALGTALSVEAWSLLTVISVFFAWIYHFIILDEESKLDRIFGEPYLVYKTLVPRFFPKLLSWPAKCPQSTLIQVNPDASSFKFSTHLAKKNKAFEAFWSFLGLIGFVTIVAWVWQN